MESSKPPRLPRRKARLVPSVESEVASEPHALDPDCFCDDCNPPRSQAVKDAEFRELCLRLCTPEQLAWHKAFRPETWVLPGEQMELFR